MPTTFSPRMKAEVVERFEGVAMDITRLIFEFQDGHEFSDYKDGDLAARSGHLHLLQTCKGLKFTSKAMDSAASNGNLAVVQWLHNNRNEGCSTDAMDAAACNGHTDVVLWLHTNRIEGCTGAALDGAARNGHLEVLKFLHENRSEGCSTLAVDFAAHNGHTEVVKWLFENRQEGCTPAAVEGASGMGHDDIVTYLRGHKRGRSVDYVELDPCLDMDDDCGWGNQT